MARSLGSVRRPAPLALLALSFALSLALVPAPRGDAQSVPERQEIGTAGATIALREGWTRRTLNRDFGKDQFLHEDEVFLVVLEHRRMLTTEEDYAESIGDIITGIEASAATVETQPLLFTEEDGRGHARQTFTVNLEGLRLAYRVDVVSRDGLTYLLMAWGLETKTETVSAYTAAVSASLEFPGPDSEWARRLEPVVRTVQVGEHEVSLEFVPAVYRESDEEDPLIGLDSADGEVSFYLFEAGQVADAEEVVTQVERILSDDGDVERVGRRSLEVAGVESEALHLRSTSSGLHVEYLIGAVPLDDETFLDLRFVVIGELERKAAMIDSLLETVTAAPVEPVDAFPEVTDRAEGSSEPSAGVARLLEVAERLGWAGELGSSQFVGMPDGALVVAQSGGVTRFAADAEIGASGEVLARWEGWRMRPHAAPTPDGGVLSVDDQDRVLRLSPDGGGAEETGVEAQAVTALPDGTWLLVRRAEAPESALFAGVEELLGDRLVLRQPAGAERTIAMLEGRGVLRLAAPREGRVVLLVTEERDPWLGTRTGTGPRLERFDLEATPPIATPLATWEQIRALVAVDGGWLVTGLPVDGPPGLYLVDDGGGSELLISGDAVFGADLVRDSAEETDGGPRLRFVSSLGTENLPGAADGHLLYEVPLAAVREVGPRVAPWYASLLEEIAARAAEEAAVEPTNGASLLRRGAIDALLRSADAVAVERAGVPLPRRAAAVDALCQVLYGGLDRALSPAAEILLAALTVRALEAEGAEWVDGERPSDFGLLYPQDQLPDSPFVLAVHPLAAVRSTLYDSDGLWRPVGFFVDRLEGRALLVGVDARTLSWRARQLEQPDLLELVEDGSARELAAALDARGENLFLRERVYRRLVALGRLEVLEKLAGRFAESRDGAESSLDRRTWLGLRLEGAERRAAAGERVDRVAEEAIDTLRTLVAAHPAEASLYLLLGRAYELLPEGAGVARARRCYREVVDRESWSAVGEEAQERLGRLDEVTAEAP